MLIFVDSRMPDDAKAKLSQVTSQKSAVGSRESSVTLVELQTEGITYPAISGHPDIFLCPTPSGLVVSPNLPEKYISLLNEHGIDFTTGFHLPSLVGEGSGEGYPESARYNAALNETYLVHRLDITDPAILERSHTLKKIPVKQGYTRCNLVLLKEDHFLASDAGIFRVLKNHALKGLCVSTEGIQLPGFPNGFIGGTMGLLGDTLFIAGNLSYLKEGERVRNFLSGLGYSLMELYDGPLFDGGSILFI
jgi:hypothetical protein